MTSDKLNNLLHPSLFEAGAYSTRFIDFDMENNMKSQSLILPGDDY